jgi:hypothetical protein
LRDIEIEGKVLLKLALQEWGVSMWRNSTTSEYGIMADFLGHGNEFSDHTKESP